VEAPYGPVPPELALGDHPPKSTSIGQDHVKDVK
jgi:hypothetical protein